jgi:hypothetical protein
VKHLVSITIKGNQLTLVGTGRNLSFRLPAYALKDRADQPHHLYLPKAA